MLALLLSSPVAGPPATSPVVPEGAVTWVSSVVMRQTVNPARSIAQCLLRNDPCAMLLRSCRPVTATEGAAGARAHGGAFGVGNRTARHLPRERAGGAARDRPSIAPAHPHGALRARPRPCRGPGGGDRPAGQLDQLPPPHTRRGRDDR